MSFGLINAPGSNVHAVAAQEGIKDFNVLLFTSSKLHLTFDAGLTTLIWVVHNVSLQNHFMQLSSIV
nr:12363_t:CDS:2 [Entrophospora candida]